MNHSFLFKPHHAIVLTMVLSLSLTGCASQYGPQITKVDHYPQCYQPMADLRADERRAASSTAGGALLGALVGALVGGLSTGKTEGALAGAAAGGIAGGAAGYAYGSSQQQKSDAQQLAVYQAQLKDETVTMNRATAAATVASQCYNAQFEQAVGAVRSGQMSKTEFAARYAEIRSGLQEIQRILTDTATVMAKKDEQYRRALTGENETVAQSDSPRLASATKASSPKKSAHPAKQNDGEPSTGPRTPEQLRAQASSETSQWQASHRGLTDTQQALQDQMNAYERTVAALEG